MDPNRHASDLDRANPSRDLDLYVRDGRHPKVHVPVPGAVDVVLDRVPDAEGVDPAPDAEDVDRVPDAEDVVPAPDVEDVVPVLDAAPVLVLVDAARDAEALVAEAVEALV